MATPPDTDASSHDPDFPTNNVKSVEIWKGKAPATIADGELEKYPIDRLIAEIDRRSSIQRPTPVQTAIPEHLPDNILNHEDFDVFFAIKKQFDDKFKEFSFPKEPSRPSIFETLKPEQADKPVATAATESTDHHTPLAHTVAETTMSDDNTGFASAHGTAASAAAESDSLKKALSQTTTPIPDDTKHPKQPETTTTAVGESSAQTHTMKHPKQPETTTTAVVESSAQTHTTKHPKQPETTTTDVTESSAQTHATKHPKQPETTTTAVGESSAQTHTTKHPKQSETTTTDVAESSAQTHATKHPKQPETTTTDVVESDISFHASPAVSDNKARTLWLADVKADIEHFRYSKEAKQWVDIEVEPECSQEVERDRRMRRTFDDIKPGPNIEEVAPADLAIDKELFHNIPAELRHAFKDKFTTDNLSYTQAHCILYLTGKASHELRASTGSRFKADQDALVISNTGSGKTEALLLTLITAILENKRLLEGRQAPSDHQRSTPTALVLVPTRTLAQQIWQTLIDMIKYTSLRGVAIYGGTSLDIDYSQLRRGCDIMVATPGRLIHLLEDTSILQEMSVLSLWKTRWFVIDEADAMLAPSFDSQLRTIQSYLPQHHNLWLFTMALRKDHTIEALRMLSEYPVTITEETLANKDEVTINEKTITKPRLHGLPMKASSKYVSVHHEIIPVTCDEDKLKHLFDYFLDANTEVGKVLILARNPKAIDLLHMSIGRDLKLPCSGLSQEYSQREREITLTEFIRGMNLILITSFQLSKGLNLPGVGTVFVHNMPWEFEEYLAAIGRVGRIGNTGIAKVFFDVKRDVGMACQLALHLIAHEQEVPDWLDDICVKEDPLYNVAEGPEAAAANQSAPTHDHAADWTQETATGGGVPL